MVPPDRPAGEPLATLTHARLRAEQGDVAGARRILDRLLLRDPLNDEARRLLRALRGSSGSAGNAPAPRDRIRRLERWLERICRRGAAED